MSTIRQEIASLIRSEKLFVFFCMIVGFCISAEYGITRPASQSIFLSVFTAKAYPMFWLATIPLNFAIVYLYNRFLPRIGALKMMSTVAASVLGINLISALLLPIFPQLIFFHFCWKDIYILLMFQQLWSMIHSTIAPARAKYLYGIIFGCGTVGSILGSLVPGFFATQFGSIQLFYFTVPLYSLILYAYAKAYQLSGAKNLPEIIKPEETSAREGFSLIKRNRTLLGIMFLLMCMQITVALVEYQFSHQLEISIPIQDSRTAFFGKLMSGINLISLLFQFIGSFLLLKVLGLQKSHVLIPLLLTTTVIGGWAYPCFAMASLAYVFTKSIDYSLFGVLREMLWVPLKLDEKFRAKSVIDVFVYRTSKACISFLLIGLQWATGAAAFAYASYISFGVLAAWFIVLFLVFAKRAQEKELPETPAS